MNQYEAMFLFDPTFGGSFENCESEIRRLMERADGEIVFCRKWDERRLAYRVSGRKRGVYVLVYFKAPADKIVGLERDVKLAENILRVLILRADEVTPEKMEQAVSGKSGADATEDAPATKPAAPAAQPPAAEKPAAETSKESSEETAATVAVETAEPETPAPEAESPTKE